MLKRESSWLPPAAKYRLCGWLWLWLATGGLYDLRRLLRLIVAACRAQTGGGDILIASPASRRWPSASGGG